MSRGLGDVYKRQKEYMGELAARIMLKRIRKGQEGELEHIIVEPNLVVRSSVGKC